MKSFDCQISMKVVEYVHGLQRIDIYVTVDSPFVIYYVYLYHFQNKMSHS